MVHSPARAHYHRVSAAHRGAAQVEMRADATQYELMLAKLYEDKRRLSEVMSFERRADIKRQLLPEYAPWIDGVLAGANGVQDDVLMTIMVWRLDVGDLPGALDIGRYAIVKNLAMPDQFKRSTSCILAEEFADRGLRDLTTAPPAPEAALAMATALEDVIAITAEKDMPDEVRAKLYKATGYYLRAAQSDVASAARLPRALELLRAAMRLHEKVGVKKDIERLERDVRNLAPASAGGG